MLFRAFSARIINGFHLGRWPRLSYYAPLALRFPMLCLIFISGNTKHAFSINIGEQSTGGVISLLRSLNKPLHTSRSLERTDFNTNNGFNPNSDEFNPKDFQRETR